MFRNYANPINFEQLNWSMWKVTNTTNGKTATIIKGSKSAQIHETSNANFDIQVNGRTVEFHVKGLSNARIAASRYVQ